MYAMCTAQEKHCSSKAKNYQPLQITHTDVYILLWWVPSMAIPGQYVQINVHVQGWLGPLPSEMTRPLNGSQSKTGLHCKNFRMVTFVAVHSRNVQSTVDHTISIKIFPTGLKAIIITHT